MSHLEHCLGRLVGGILMAGFATASYSLVTMPTAQAATPKYAVVFETQLTGASNGAPAAPEASQAFKAVFAGTPVTVDVCDDQGTTTGNIDCEHEAVVNHAAAFVVNQSNEDQSLVDQANIPVIGVANDTSPQSFDISGQQGLFAGMAVALQKTGCKRIGTAIAEGGQSYAAQVANAEHWQSVTDAYLPLGAPDLTADIAKLVQAHVQCVDLATVGSQIPQALTAMRQAGLHVPVAVPGIVVTPEVQRSLGSLGNGLILVETTPSPSSPSVANVVKKLHAKGITVDAASLTSWATARVIEDGAANVHGSVTNTSLLSGLNRLRNASTDGVYPSISMKPQSNPVTRRDFDTYVQTFVLKNGSPTQPSGFFNVAPEISVALKNG